MPNSAENYPRRQWLLASLQAAIVATGAAILYPVAKFLKPRPATASGATEVVAPFRVAQLLTTKDNPFEFGGKPCLIVPTAEGAEKLARGEMLRATDLSALSALCTHTDCTVAYRPERQDIYCSCHEGIYDLHGRNISGPPPRPLESFRVTLRGEPGKEEIVVSRHT